MQQPADPKVFVFRVVCTETKTTWLLKKSFTQFEILRSKLDRIDRNIRKESIASESLLDLSLEIDLSRMDVSYAVCYRQLQMYTIQLSKLRLECMALALVPKQSQLVLYRINQIYVVLSNFLQVPSIQVEMELRSIVFNAYYHDKFTEKMLQLMDYTSPTYLLFELNDIFQLKYVHGLPKRQEPSHQIF